MESILAFLNAPPTWAAILILLAGVWVINMMGDAFALFVAVVLGAFVWFALGTFAATLSMGWPYVLGWVAVAFVILYNMGWLVDKERYLMLTVNLVLILVVSTLVGTHAYKLSFWMSFGASLIVVASYLLIGLCVAYFKWRFYNQRKLEDLLTMKVQYLQNLSARHESMQTMLRRFRDQESNSNPGSIQKPYREIEKPAFDEQFLEAVLTLPKERRELQNLAVPEPLKRAYLEHISGYQVPSAFESKQKFFAWLAAWPGVFIHMLFSELIERLWKWVYRLIENRLNAVQRSVFKGHEEFLKIR